MDNPFGAEFQEALLSMGRQESAMNAIWTLAIEYNAKTITPERFAQRTYAILYEWDQRERAAKK